MQRTSCLGAVLLAAAAGCGPAVAQQTRCIDEGTLPPLAAVAPRPPASEGSARERLAGMVRDAQSRSQALGAVALLADAAQSDLQEARAAKGIQASVNAGLGPATASSLGVTQTSTLQLRGGLQVSQMIADGGRLNRLIDWRAQLAEAARFGKLSADEQVALNTVSLALERSRYRQQAIVYDQYARKMACLVEALESIVAADRGRASELVQARKSLQQAELSRVQAQSQGRLADVRLRRFLGDALPPADGLTSVLLTTPNLQELMVDAARSFELAQFSAQVAAADQFAQSVEASMRPQVSWSIGSTAAIGSGGNAGNQRNSNVAVGINVNIPLTNAGAVQATDAARRRAAAAMLQRDDALEARRSRMAETYEQALSALDRARRTSTVLNESDQLRNFTLQQWQQLGRRSLFDVMATEGDHYNLRVQYVNALHDLQQLNAVLLSLGRGVGEWLK